MHQHLHQFSTKICIRYNMKVKNLTPDEDVDTSKISPVLNLSTQFHQ